MTGRKDDPAFIYFPANYRWSMGLLLCLSGAPWGGAEIDEVNRVGRALRDKVGDDKAWFDEWARMGDKVEARGREEEKKGHKLTAAACLMRAAHYYQTGERFLQRDPRAGAIYQKAVKSFADAAAMIARPRIESVEVPYGDKTLPALFVHAAPEVAGNKPAPAVVFFDGFDITKEIQYFKGIPDLVARGIACLIVDGPGNGESVRFRDLPLIAETETYGTAAYEYLASSRREVDPKRIGVMAISLGGYYAPRAASLEPRFAACVAWGAQWDYYEVWKKRFDLLDSGTVPSLSVPPEHLIWVFGVDSREKAMKKLEGFRLDGIVQQMKCPFLLVHGAGDEQIPLALAERCFAAVGSKEKMLKVFSREEGGFHHCQVDDVTIGVHFMWDWLADVLKPGT